MLEQITEKDEPTLASNYSSSFEHRHDLTKSGSTPKNGPRVMLYSHDTFGLGHTERTVSIAGAILERYPDTNVLYVTGSPMIQNLKLPRGMDYVKLPSAVKLGSENYAARSIDLSFGELVQIRSQLVKTVAEEFLPDVLLVDHAPIGMAGEILPTLKTLRKNGRTKIVLGLRDVLDDPASVAKVWKEQGIVEALRKYYDLILVYGMKEFFNPVSEYEIPRDLNEKIFFTGYVYRPRPVRSADQVREQFNLNNEPMVLVTVGGGEDARDALELVKKALRLRRLEGFSALVTTGPMCPQSVRQSLSELQTDSNIRIIDFVDDLPALIAASNLVLSMGGYNSLSELLAYGRRGIVLPRIQPRREQLVRATFLANMGFVTKVDPSKCSPLDLREMIEASLRESDEPISERRHMVKLDGGRIAAELILALALERNLSRRIYRDKVEPKLRPHLPTQSDSGRDGPRVLVPIGAGEQK